ncbi:MFS transporter [Thioalkalivibrio sp. HK1]|uniref:MFS transporter n=1 Tax=Thioalkalivibrio sp. HK1 TaxID=1469245 RepID=UPI0004725B75|nr:MFS transporter [Thioalkalivibrio sp. HK1]
MNRDRIHFLFLNIGHFLDHFFMLIFATVAALRLSREWGMEYSELIPLATPGFAAFGLASIPVGWIADKWSREGMMVIFFVGIGASSIATALAQTPLQIAGGLFAIGVFAAIYHPVGLAMVVQGRRHTGIPLAINGVFGNLGVACAALITGFLIDNAGWRSAFVVPGIITIAIGVAYGIFLRKPKQDRSDLREGISKPAAQAESIAIDPKTLVRVFAIIVFTTAIGGLNYQSGTFALPEILEERLEGFVASATEIGTYAFVIFAVASFAQLVIGYLLDRHSVRTIFAFVAATQALFLLLMINLTGPMALLVSTAFMLAVFGQIPINDVLIGRIARSEWRSRAYSIRYIVNFSVMATTLPLIAWIHATKGFGTLFAVMSIAAGMIFIAVLLLPNKGRIVLPAQSSVSPEARESHTPRAT